MTRNASITEPDLSSRPFELRCERMMAGPPHVLYPAWTTESIASWFAAQDTVLMKPEINVPHFFETRFEGHRSRWSFWTRPSRRQSEGPDKSNISLQKIYLLQYHSGAVTLRLT